MALRRLVAALAPRSAGVPCLVLSSLFLVGITVSAQGQVSVGELKGQIVFSSNRTGPWRIWIMNADGSGLRQLTPDEGASETHDVDPVFSPNGKTVLFTSTRGGATGIWTIPTSGGELAQICEGDQAEWSPDAKRIAFRRANRLWLRDLGSGEETPLTPEDWGSCSGPAWSPDGRTIVFAARWEGDNGLYLISVDGDSDSPQKVYDKKGACEPHFTPDGALIIYETETNICTVLPDGTKNRMVTYQGGIQRFGRASPDGRFVVYCQGPAERGPWELYVAPIKGGLPVKLTEGGSDMNPDWK